MGSRVPIISRAVSINASTLTSSMITNISATTIGLLLIGLAKTIMMHSIPTIAIPRMSWWTSISVITTTIGTSNGSLCIVGAQVVKFQRKNFARRCPTWTTTWISFYLDSAIHFISLALISEKRAHDVHL